MTGPIQQFPQRGTAFQDAGGQINSVWYRTMLAMWTRTGGGTSDATTQSLQAQITGKVTKAGDTMTGALILNGTPSASLQAAPKSYVDTEATTRANADTAETAARIAADALLLPLSGGTMTGSPVGPIYTVAGLPAGLTGARAFVSDATVTTFASTVVGGGLNFVPVFYQVAWKIG